MNYIVLNVCNTPISWFMTSGGFVVVVLVLSFSCVPVRPTQFSGDRQWESELGLLHSKHIRCVSVWCVLCEGENGAVVSSHYSQPLFCVEACEEVEKEMS